MPIEFRLNDSTSSSAQFITYAPSPAALRQTGGSGALKVTVSSRRASATGGEAVFYTQPVASSQASLTLMLPADGSWVPFFVGGKWSSPSIDRDDCLVEVAPASGAASSFPCMVRVRKNANTLTARERDRFVGALGALNASGVYQAFRNVHVGPSDNQMHGGPYFLPWHRAYLLDLERELQAVDDAVTIPYWRFDEPAPAVFDAAFMGATQSSTSPNVLPSKVSFANGHPLSNWVIDGAPGVLRTALFNPLTAAAKSMSQTKTLALGSVFSNFRAMEGNPHGSAHVSFVGPIQSPPTAPRDPLFFLLHCNVDRLWALWQWLNHHRTAGDPDAYEAMPPNARKGSKLGDTFWPWDDDKTSPQRPTIPIPRTPLKASPVVSAPGSKPILSGTIDVDGFGATSDRLGFGYDDVPFEKS